MTGGGPEKEQRAEELLHPWEKTRGFRSQGGYPQSSSKSWMTKDFRIETTMETTGDLHDFRNPHMASVGCLNLVSEDVSWWNGTFFRQECRLRLRKNHGFFGLVIPSS